MNEAAKSLVEAGALGCVIVILFALVFYLSKEKSNDNKRWSETVKKINDDNIAARERQENRHAKSLSEIKEAHEKAGDKISSAIERALLFRPK